MPRVTGAGFLLAAFLMVFPACLPAAEGEKSEAAAKAAEAFESLYGKDWKRVKSTGDVRDDIELAKKLLAAATEAKDQPEFLAILCEKACELATSPMGYATAAEALEREAAGVPEKASAVAARLLEIRQKQFDASKGDERAAAGEALIEALLRVADAREKVRDAAGAAALLRRALVAAAAAKSDRRPEIEARLKTLEQSLRTAREIEDLKRLLEADPNKVAARERLVKLYLVDLDDPAQAAKWVQGVEDTSLRRYVPGAAKPVADAPEYACLELGEWYRGLGETAPPAAKAAMFARAQAYYNRFLELHAAADLDRTKAKAALQKIESDLAKSSAPLPPRPTKQPKEPAKEARWIDLAAMVNLSVDTIRGAWRRRDGALAITNRIEWACLIIPVIPEGSYQVEAKFVRKAGDGAFGVFLPVGKGICTLEFSVQAGEFSGLQRIDGKPVRDNATGVKPGIIENGREYSLSVKVALSGDQAEITVTLDGKPFTRWQGKPTSLSIYQDWTFPNQGALGLAAWNAEVDFRNLRLRMLSGEAKPLRPDGKPAAPEKPATGEKPAPKGVAGKWIDVLALVDPAKDTVTGVWQRRDSVLLIDRPEPWACMTAPILPQGDYELEIRFVRTSGRDPICIFAPVGSTAFDLELSAFAGDLHGLQHIDGRSFLDTGVVVKPGRLDNGHEYCVALKVRTQGQATDVAVTLDGKPLMSWQGKASCLSIPGEWHMPSTTSLGFGAWNVQAVFRSVRLRMLSGEAKLLRPGEKPAAGAEPGKSESGGREERFAAYQEAWDSSKDRIDTQAVRALVARLRSESVADRTQAIAGLEAIAGDQFGYRPDGPAMERERGLARWEVYAQDLEKAVAEWAPCLTRAPSMKNRAERALAAWHMGGDAPHAAFLPLLRQVVANNEDNFADNAVRIHAIKAISMIRHDGLMEYLIDHLDTDLAFWVREQLDKLTCPLTASREGRDQAWRSHEDLNRRRPGEDWPAFKKRYQEWWQKSRATFVYNRSRIMYD